MISDQDIQDLCTRVQLVRGKALTASKAVEIVKKSQIDVDRYDVEATVNDEGEYHVRLNIDESKTGGEKFTSFLCDGCEVFCRHCAAVAHQLVLDRLDDELKGKLVSAKEIEEHNIERMKSTQVLNTPNNRPDESATKRALSSSATVNRIINAYSGVNQAFKNDSMMDDKGMITHSLVSLYPKLHVSSKGKQEIEFLVGTDERTYVIKDLYEFLDSVDNKEFHKYGKALAFVHDYDNFTEEGKYYINMLRDLKSSKVPNSYYFSSVSNAKTMKISDGYVEELILRNIDKKISLNGVTMDIVEGNPSLKLMVYKEEEGALLKVDTTTVIRGRDRKFVADNKDSTIYVVSEDYIQNVIPFLEEFNAGDDIPSLNRLKSERGVYIDSLDYEMFCGHVLRRLTNYIKLEEHDIKLEEFMPPPCDIKIYLDAPNEHAITCNIKAEYGTEVYNVSDWTTRNLGSFRDIEKEQNVYWAAKRYFYDEERSGADYLLKTEDEDKIYDFLISGHEELEKYGELFVSDSIRKINISASTKITAGVQIKGNLLEMTLDMPDMSEDQISDILAAYRAKKRYYRMKSGDFLKLKDTAIETVFEMSEGLGITEKDWDKGVVELPLYRANYIDSIVKDKGKKLNLVRSSEFKSVIRTMREIEDSDYEIPDSVDAELRGYQKTGFRWLKTLSYYGFGGILADDMGLGKTLQIITLLESAVNEDGYDRQGNISLIVCPASLVYNWENECNRFAKNLRVSVIVGNADLRKEILNSLENVDVIVTSYDLLKRDFDIYKDMKFDYVVADEAQYIKNSRTQVAKTVKAIEGRHRFALTGTPVENRLSDLWSIFDFCMKGYLFSSKRFTSEFEKPIVTDHDEDVLNRLKSMTSPFILRRKKKDVLLDLPDKIEQVVYTSMTDKQKDFYTARFLNLKNMIASMDTKQYKDNQIAILSEITRLRQSCLDPSLFVEGYKGGSGKVDAFYEMAAELIDNGSNVLVFSQFATMLEELKVGLEKEGIKTLILTGSTSKEERRRLVDEFQSQITPTIFLISLKAGGTGLNLTAADTVIHFDPWWNVAAQNQATDRAHRIGQDKVVNVIQLVTKNSIEEKIIELQNRKKELVDDVVEGEGVSDASLSREEVIKLLEI